jgi:signal transduction histidine kinase
MLFLVGGTLISEYLERKSDANDSLYLLTQLRSHYLAQHLALLAKELARLGFRSEMNLLDRNMEPERSLLKLSHHKSTFFNTGVAIIDRDGIVAWSEPPDFVPVGKSFAHAAWFENLAPYNRVRYVPVNPERETDALIYVVSPIVRDNEVAGALLGGVDLAKDTSIDVESSGDIRAKTQNLLVSQTGAIIYPPKPPPFSKTSAWHEFVKDQWQKPRVASINVSQTTMIAASAPVSGTDLLLLSIADEKEFFAQARSHLFNGLALVLGIAIVPLVILILLLRRSLQNLRRSELEALREERLVHLGEAVNLIAHEIKNSLNSLYIGLDLVLSAKKSDSEIRNEKALSVVRAEIHRISDFTQDLLTFSKGIELRPTRLDIVDLIPTIVELLGPRASENGVTLDIDSGPAGVAVTRVDPKYIRIVLVNLISNAFDSLEQSEQEIRRVQLHIATSRQWVSVRVNDNGPGVPRQVKDRLFEPFVTGKPNGVGIGLALSRQIARTHGGDLVLEPTDEGASFLLTLPLLAKS